MIKKLTLITDIAGVNFSACIEGTEVSMNLGSDEAYFFDVLEVDAIIEFFQEVRKGMIYV